MSYISDVSNDLGYYELLGKSEKARWVFHDLPWDELDESKVTPDLIHNVKTAAYGELTTFSATESFMKLFHNDIDFTQWLAVWFYEETKHPLSLVRYLSKLSIPTDETFIHRGREISPMLNDRTVMLVSNICSEIAANIMYNYFLKMADEKLLAEIIRNLARDEMRHSNGFQYYCKKTIKNSADPDGERLKALRTTWFLVDPGSYAMTEHPVYLTVRSTRGFDADEAEKRIREKIVFRMAKVLELDMPPTVDGLYDFYAQFKKSYRASRKAVPDFAEAD
jgi:rubrerythrin